jgi:homoserine O-acetyltransferase
MRVRGYVARVCAGAVIALFALVASAADFPAPKEGSWIVRDFKFHTGEVLPELRLTTPRSVRATGEPVLILHGTTGSGTGMLSPAFAGELFGPGQPLDATRYYIILTDAIGTGNRASLRTAAHALPAVQLRRHGRRAVSAGHEHLEGEAPAARDRQLDGRHADVDLGAEVSGVHGRRRADGVAATEMSSRNWMLRRLIIDSIRNDPEWMNGNYTKQPKSLPVRVGVLRARDQRRQPGALQGCADAREGRPAPQSATERTVRGDANDHLYQWESSRDYNPSPASRRSRPRCSRINSADDERNPPEIGVLDREIKRVKNGRVFLIAASENTAGHGTTGQARFWKSELAALLQSAPRLAP